MFELNKIYIEDCFKTIDRMVSDNIKVDTILTSPPYNMTKRKGGYADTGRYDVYKDWKSEEDYIGWTINLFNKFDTILKEQRAVIYNFSYSIENPSLPYKLVTAIVKNTPFDIVDTIVWKKKCGLPFPANGKRLSRNWEYVFVFVRKNEVNTYENNRKIKSVSEKTGQKYYEAIYNFVEALNNDEKCPYNQATYSSELCCKLMNIYTQKGWLVYDPFMGSGTTALACKKMGLEYIGSEISSSQVEYAEKRLTNSTKREIRI